MKDFLDTIKFLFSALLIDIVKPLVPVFVIALFARIIVYVIGVVLRLIRNFGQGDDYDF